MSTIPLFWSAKQGIRANVNAAAGWSVGSNRCEEFQRLTGSDDDTATDDTAALALSATAMLLCHVSKPLRTPQFCL